MTESLIANRYARALFRISDNSLQKSKEYLAILQAINALFEEKKIAKVLLSPIMPNDLKLEILTHVIKGYQADDPFKNFITFVVNEGRVGILNDLSYSFKQIINRLEGVLEGKVVSALELNESLVNELKDAIEARINKKLVLSQVIDKSVLGSFVIYLENKLIDLSLKSKLDAIWQEAIR